MDLDALCGRCGHARIKHDGNSGECRECREPIVCLQFRPSAPAIATTRPPTMVPLPTRVRLEAWWRRVRLSALTSPTQRDVAEASTRDIDAILVELQGGPPVDAPADELASPRDAVSR